MKILLLEPDEYYHQEFRDSLPDEFEITAAKNLREAQTLLRGMEPEAVVAELLLEDGASFPVIKNLRLARGRSSLPVIIFSEMDHLEDIEHALSLGVSGYFVKGKDSVSDVYKLLLSLKQ